MNKFTAAISPSPPWHVQSFPVPPWHRLRPKPKVALVMKSLANEFFLNMENGAREYQKANASKFDLIANGIKGRAGHRQPDQDRRTDDRFQGQCPGDRPG